MSTLRSQPLLRDLTTGKPLPSLRMTEKQFAEWADEDTRAEWVDGKVVLMSPVSVDHDDLMGYFYMLLRGFVEAQDLGRVMASEVTVRFADLRCRRLPDLKFVAKSRLDMVLKNQIEGAPDQMMEIVSPDSVARDWREKYLEYEKAGVKGYWIVDPLTQKLEAHHLRGRKYSQIKLNGDRIESKVLPGFFVKPASLWKKPLSGVLRVLREMGVK